MFGFGVSGGFVGVCGGFVGFCEVVGVCRVL